MTELLVLALDLVIQEKTILAHKHTVREKYYVKLYNKKDAGRYFLVC